MYINHLYKRSIIIGILICFAINGYSQNGISTAYLYKGYWSNWNEAGFEYVDIMKKRSAIGLAGNNGGFCLYKSSDHPSDYFFYFSITGYSTPTKKEIKKHYKAKEAWVYNGYVEYYVCDVYPTIEDCFKELGRPLQKSDLEAYDYNSKLSLMKASQIKKSGYFTPIGYKKIKKTATIKIMPYKKLPQVYNFFFDNVGYAIDLGMYYVLFDPNRKK